MAFITVLALAFGTCSVFQLITEQERERTVAHFKKPGSIIRHEQWMKGERPSGGDTAESPPPDVHAGAAAEALTPDEQCAKYTDVFEQLERAWAGRSDAADLRRSGLNSLGVGCDLPTATEVAFEQLVQANPALLQSIRALAELGGPICPLDLSKGLYSDAPYVRSLQECALILCCSAKAETRQGNLEQGIQDLLAALKFADTLACDPYWMSFSTHVRIYRVASRVLQDGCASGDVPRELADELLARLRGAYHREAFADSLASFEYSVMQMLSDVRESPVSEIQRRYDATGIVGVAGIWGLRSPPAQLFISINESHFVELCSRFVELASRPPYETRSLVDQIQREEEGGSLLHWFADVKFTPVLIEMMLDQAKHEATVDLMRIGVALEVYRSEKGTYPETLEEVAGVLGGVVPLDAFTGKPYLYEPRGHSFVLQSSGTVWCYDPEQRHSGRLVVLSWRGGQRSP